MKIIDHKKYYIPQAMFLYQVIIASEPLLELAVSKSTGKLLDYLKTHLEEERGHEKWLADDLLSIGVDVKQIPYNPIVGAMVGSQFYIINYANPVAFLGYMAFLECHPLPMTEIEALEEIYGKDLIRTLRYHAVHDVDHGSDLKEFILNLDEKEQKLVKDNFLQTAEYYGREMERIERTVPPYITEQKAA
ncbi:MAG: hypothetical protein HQK87_10705 [Nitrospinae bacterium]|nr:hypothetical protein [Nitrospinota bacterium]